MRGKSHAGLIKYLLEIPTKVGMTKRTGLGARVTVICPLLYNKMAYAMPNPRK